MKQYFLTITYILVILLISCTSSKKNTLSSITEQNWVLKELNGSAVTITGPRQPFIIFHQKDNRVNGNAGCNNFFGSYQIEKNQVKITNVGATKMACQDMELETRFLQLLQESLVFSSRGNELMIKNRDGNLVARFEKGTN